MFIPNRNTLQQPDAVFVPNFEDQLKKFKKTVINYINERDPKMAAAVAETLNNEAELSTKIIEACTVILQSHIREINANALQMFGTWATGNNLDAVVSNLGIERQVINPGDPAAFPPVPAVYESDEHLRLRYFLAPFSFSNAGPGLAYKFHALTLGERPTITVETPKTGTVVVKYQFAENSINRLIRDAVAIRTAPGKILVSILARAGNGHANNELINAVNHYLKRDDVAPLTDDITVKPAEIINYKINAVVYIHRGPDSGVIKSAAEMSLKNYVDDSRYIGATIEPSRIHHALHAAGAVKIELIEPKTAITTTQTQSPYCQHINVEIRHL